MSSAGRRRTVRAKSLVGFRVGGVRYAVDIMKVREIVNPLPLVELPRAPDVVLGVADHRGQVVPVLDLRRRFSVPGTVDRDRSKWVIVTLAGRPVALVADSVTEVFGVESDEQRSQPPIGGDTDVRGIHAVFSVDGELVFVLDIDRVASPVRELPVG